MIVLVRPKRATNIDLSAQLGGTLDGANRVFTTPNNYKSGKISLLYNGQSLHSPEDFSETGSNEITFNHFAPYSDDVLRVTYEIE